MVEDDEVSLAYDLRQIYAKDIVGEHLKDIANARKQGLYSVYFQTLKDLHAVIRHKFDDNEKHVNEYNTLIKNIIEVANKYPMTWIGKDRTPQPCAEIEELLNNLEIFFYKVMDDNNMFGVKFDDDGL